MSGLIDDEIAELDKGLADLESNLESSVSDIADAAEEVAQALEAVSESSGQNLVARIETAMSDLLKHVAALISHHS